MPQPPNQVQFKDHLRNPNSYRQEIPAPPQYGYQQNYQDQYRQPRQHQMNYNPNPPNQNPYPYQQQGMNQMYNMNQPYPYNNNYQAPPNPPYKDPMVWDPISPKHNKHKKKRKKTSTNPNKPDIKVKREYNKPWKVAKKEPNQKQKKKECKSKFLDYHYPDGDGPDADLILRMERNLLTKDTGVNFDDIAGLDKAKEVLKLNVLCPLLMKDFFTQIRKPPKGILLYGPAGTGKTMLAKAIANTGKTTFININPATLANKWRGDSEKMVRLLFEMARFYAPTTIFIDEIDSLISERSNQEHEASRKVKVQFFVEIDGIANDTNDQKDKPKVFILAATNRPWDLDQAILRRLSKRLYIPLPDANSRKKLFELKLKNINLAKDIKYDILVKKTKMYNSDDIESVCREAALAPFKKRMSKITDESAEFMKELEKELIEEQITMADLLDAVKNVKSSASTKYLSKYKEWTEKHSSS